MPAQSGTWAANQGLHGLDAPATMASTSPSVLDANVSPSNNCSSNSSPCSSKPTSFVCTRVDCHCENKDWITRTKLKQHERCFTKKYKCPDKGCNMAFSTRPELRRHLGKIKEPCPNLGCSVRSRKDNLPRHLKRCRYRLQASSL